MNTNPVPSSFISLESIQIASPCRAQWAKMTGDDKTRFCASCAKNVYNLAAMSREEAQQLIAEKEGDLCVRLHRRADGTVITSDCPVGISTTRKGFGWLGELLFVAAAAIFGMFGIRVFQSGARVPITISSGAVAILSSPVSPPSLPPTE